MAHRSLDENRDSSMRSARYRLDGDSSEEHIPADEYAQRTGKTFGDKNDVSAAIPHFRAGGDVWEVANSALDAAFARGDFDNLAYAGKPIPGLGATDQDWWVKGIIEREHISGLGPLALMLRKEDAELEATLDRLADPAAVRELLEDFNFRVVKARRQLLGGPPVITALRDIDDEIAAWKSRRSPAAQADDVPDAPRRARWLGRWLGARKTP
ncbi:DnaJ family domain-containing protein [Paeniglutamicibacter sp.]|uniref:DnaJ family domain-containing protein n=1 Tax=Paeniglutamicibacter sp. TaxID=1934391 RepID=UPI0039893576